MTTLQSSIPEAQTAAAETQPRAWPMVLLGFAVAAALCWPQILRVWTTGAFTDTDDAMRMVQVRDWLAGQGWFDLTAHRFDPPPGLPMHWSRVVDLPVGGLLRLAGLLLAPEEAERAARIAYPLLLQLALLGVMASLGRLLCGPRGAACAIALTVLSGFMWGQFVPGRIDHHSLQIVLLMATVASLLASLDPGRAGFAGLAAACTAVSLSVSLETLPHLAVAAGILPLAWALEGRRHAAALWRFGAGLLLALPAALLVFHAAADRFAPACDAFSTAQLWPGLVGGAACVGLALLRPQTRAGRLSLLAAAASAVGGAVALHGACFADPFTGLDPLVRSVWLAHTTEARSLREVLRIHPTAWPMLLMPVLLGVAGIGAAAVASRGTARSRWLALLPVALAGVATEVWIIRGESTLAPLALLGGVFACSRAWTALDARIPRGAPALALLLCLPFSSLGWVLLAPMDENVPERDRLAAAATCREPAAYRPLARLAPGLVFAPMDAGAHLLAHTPHRVLAGPYHRNNRGNRLVIDAWLADAASAEALVRGSGARWLMICPGQVQLDVTSRRAPHGLAADLLAGRIPAWLQPVEVADTPFRVFAIR